MVLPEELSQMGELSHPKSALANLVGNYPLSCFSVSVRSIEKKIKSFSNCVDASRGLGVEQLQEVLQ